MNKIKEICTGCGKQEVEWDFGDEKYCQMCWETYCAEEYYKYFGW